MERLTIDKNVSDMSMSETEAILRLKDHFRIHRDGRPHPFLDIAEAMAYEALSKIKQYHEIGTVDECRTAVERMKPKNPIWKPIFECDEDCKEWHCPTCDEVLTDRIPFNKETFYFHCLNCGQTLDWNESEE